MILLALTVYIAAGSGFCGVYVLVEEVMYDKFSYDHTLIQVLIEIAYTTILWPLWLPSWIMEKWEDRCD